MAMTTAAASIGAATSLLIQGPQVRLHSSRQQQQVHGKRACGKARAVVSEVVEASQSVQAAPDLTWQIWAGAIAGVTPFMVAGVEFSKRIAAQQRCSACGGSGLVKRSGTYFRCGNCGGFLPWYSWRRFFKG